ncbi:MAG: Spy/CpxP family protein refolding chaperone [Deltaproteobacteria bacterium]|nr:Spy/CpxP family protein refolding chaperone [Deltaproteobacteria bacterium]
MKTSIRKSAMTMAAVLAAFTLTAGTGFASTSATHGKAGYERCDSKDHAKHLHGKASKEWKKTLTQEQRTQMRELHASLEKKLAPLEARVGVKRAEIRAVAASDNPDMAALKKLVEEISALEKETMQSRYENMIKVRSLLTPEQKAAFDISLMKHGDHGHRHRR